MAAGIRVNWGILGPGNIARSFAAGLADSQYGRLEALATRDPARPGLAETFPGARILSGYEALLADPAVDAIYISIPHPFHAEWSIKAAEAGKHVLCEKPMALSAHEADAVFHAAERAGVFMGEAFMYRLHPQTTKLAEMIRAGVIGDVRLIRSNFGFAMPEFLPEHRLYSNDLAGGGILDVGGYPVSMARLLAGAAAGSDFAEPHKVSGMAHLGVSGVDEWASAVLQFPGGIIAEVSCSISLQQDNVLRVFGTTGRIEVTAFWFAGGRTGGTGRISVVRPDGSVETTEVAEPRHLFSFEADAASEAILAGRRAFAPPGMTRDDTLGNLRVLDKWRKDAGLVFDIETPVRSTRTLRGDRLQTGPQPMARRRIPGLGKPVSPVALGFEFFEGFPGAAIMLDAFYERGGNVFDTAFVYGDGLTESLFGDWHTSRGLDRSDLVLIGKGAHTPLCYPDVIARQLDASLERLKTDHVDVYFMHRDNPDVPVGEFVDALDAEVRRGRIRGPFGGSNWTMARMDEAIGYARRTGKAAPSALSNNLSLAEMVAPVWPGCVSSSSAGWRQWLTERQVPVFAWSSQGRGFFTDRAGPGRREDAELVASWYSDENFARRERAQELAARRGCKPIHIALAYVLAQPFPTVALIGPRRLGELDDSLSALGIELTADEVGWLAG